MKNTKRPASFIPCGACQGSAGISISARCCVIIGSSSNDDGDVNENGEKEISLDWQNNNFARASRFFVHFFTFSAMPNFTFCSGGRGHSTTTFFFVS